MTKEQDNITKVERLVKLFKPERYTYLIICSISCLFLIGCAILLIIRDIQSNIHIVLGMFGSSGIISYSIGKLLTMWKDAFKAIFD